jgi:hypothetical protein
MKRTWRCIDLLSVPDVSGDILVGVCSCVKGGTGIGIIMEVAVVPDVLTS